MTRYNATHEIYSRTSGKLLWLYDSTKDFVLNLDGEVHVRMPNDFTRMVAGSSINTSSYVFREINVCLENK